MERRVLLAILLSFLVLYFYQVFVIEPARRQALARRAATQATQPGAGAPSGRGGPAAAAREDRTAGAAREAALEESVPAPVLAGDAERFVTVETEDIRVVLSNRGAHVQSWRLKKYTEANGELVDLVPQGLSREHPRPFLLKFDDAPLTRRLNEALFRYSVDGRESGGGAGPTRIVVAGAPRTVTFEYSDVTGLRVRKSFVFSPASYVIVFSAEVRQGDRMLNPVIEWGPGLGDSAPVSAYSQAAQGILYRAGRVERLDAGDLGTQDGYDGPFRYVGVDDHYFFAGALGPVAPARVTYRVVPMAMPGRDKPVRLVSFALRYPAPPSGARFYVGPKLFSELQAVDQELVRVINFGMFAWLVVPLLKGLNGVNQYVHNYGWAIIILTIFINAAMFPLRHKSVVSMRKMQELQPEVKAIQDRYKNFKATDPAMQKMRTELMTLYRERGVNPASGCIPMLLTMPVLFAFYALLSVAIEIRGAPFILWIKDLSLPDPFYVTPLLMGGSMFVQQKMTPMTGADPTQQKVMMFMPAVFTVMMLWAPSGLVIYWFVSNLLAIAQQYLTNKLIGPPAVRHARPPAERRVRHAGSGRTEAASASDRPSGRLQKPASKG